LTAGRTRADSGASAVRTYWLISRGPGAGGVFVLDPDGLGRSLPVFGFKEEAELFLRLGSHDGDGWHARESSTGELVSLLYGPCADVGSVALDPLPGMAADGTLALVSVGREGFLERLLDEGAPGRGARRTRRRDPTKNRGRAG
jgi:hypothetical protein